MKQGSISLQVSDLHTERCVTKPMAIPPYSLTLHASRMQTERFIDYLHTLQGSV